MRKLKKTGEIIAICGASVNILVSIIFISIFVELNNTFDLGSFFSMIVSILCIVFCAIDLGKRTQKASIASLIFVGLSLAFSIYFDRVITLMQTYGYIYPLMIIAFIYSGILLHKNIFNSDKVEEEVVITKENVVSNPLKELEKLYELKSKNLITEDEYEEKRANLISKM